LHEYFLKTTGNFDTCTKLASHSQHVMSCNGQQHVLPQILPRSLPVDGRAMLEYGHLFSLKCGWNQQSAVNTLGTIQMVLLSYKVTTFQNYTVSPTQRSGLPN